MHDFDSSQAHSGTSLHSLASLSNIAISVPIQFSKSHEGFTSRRYRVCRPQLLSLLYWFDRIDIFVTLEVNILSCK